MKTTRPHASWVIGALALWVVAGCSDASQPSKPPPLAATFDARPVDASPDLVDDTTAAPPPPPRRLWTEAIPDAATFAAYSKELGGERFTKFVYDLRSQAIYYFDVDVYRVHKDFVFAELYKTEVTKAGKRAYDRNYSATKPEFVLCYLVHHVAANKWTLALWAGDKAKPTHIEQAFAKMRATFYLGDQVAFRPDSAPQEAMSKRLKGVPVLLNDALYKGSTLQVFNPGRAIGTLRIVPPGTPEDELEFATDEIVILPAQVSEITPVAGIISEEFSTPLSHVSLRARAWGIPNIGLRGAATTHAALAGKPVVFEATGTGYALRAATDAEWSAARAAVPTRQAVVPAANLTDRALRPLDALRARDGSTVGAKAANLGEIVARKPVGFVVPPGFAVPIAHYQAHLTRHGLNVQLAALLDDKATLASAKARKAALQRLREAIVAAPLDPALLDEIEAQIALLATAAAHGTIAAPPTPTAVPTDAAPASTPADAAPPPAIPGVFVRSSTNAEDLPGFNGAGLYDTVPNVQGRAALEAAVKQVWASVWNLRAFDERAFYGIDQRAVYGAVLIQRAAQASSAGVMITAHPTDPLETTVFQINAKKGFGMSVVDGKRVPEILLFNHHNNALRVVSRSAEDTMLVADDRGGVRTVPNPNPGRPVISLPQARALGRAGRQLQRAFPAHPALDIEWVFVGDELNIVQARPYVTPPAP